MNIRPVSFGNVDSAARFQEMIAKPQTFALQNTAVASTPVAETGKKKGGVFGKILGVLAVAALALVGISYAAKKGKFNVNPEEGSKVVNTVKKYLGKVGNGVNDFVAKHAKDLNKVKDAAQEAAQDVAKA